MVLGQKHVSFALRRAWVKCCLPTLRCVPLGVRHWSVKWYLKSVRRAAHSQGAATHSSGTRHGALGAAPARSLHSSHLP